jgi:hypothetical protein
MKFAGCGALGAIALFISCRPDLLAQSSSSKEGLAIVEIGGAPSVSLNGSGLSISPTVAVEVTPIENWLELELGTTPTFSRSSTEWVTDLLFKKPWTLSKKVELMVGVGPEWIHTRNNRGSTNAIGGEAAVDFMFWPGAKRRFGWYLEPAYERQFGAGREASLSISGGLLITIP